MTTGSGNRPPLRRASASRPVRPQRPNPDAASHVPSDAKARPESEIQATPEMGTEPAPEVNRSQTTTPAVMSDVERTKAAEAALRKIRERRMHSGHAPSVDAGASANVIGEPTVSGTDSSLSERPARRGARISSIRRDARYERPQPSTKLASLRERIAESLRPKPWRRPKRGVVVASGVVLGLVLLAVAALFFLPQLKVSHVVAHGVGYSDTSAITHAADQALSRPIAFVNTDAIDKKVSALPGIQDARVERKWPNTLVITVTEKQPIGVLNVGGKTSIVDASGAELPASAGEKKALPQLVVAPETADVKGTSQALVQIVGVLPTNVHSSMVAAQASTPSNVTLTLKTDKGDRTIVWGSSDDSDLKAKVLVALLGQPGGTIDVSSPHAPTIR